ncbi:hypothetical protein B0H11DRAFT_2270370 [Mycena galericulata]|nr:hypothetical protein B0H11DRAFT_2270370 [Mycena galericulata]
MGQTVAAATTKPVTRHAGAREQVPRVRKRREHRHRAPILWGKQQNAGQPVYVLVPRAHRDAVVTAFKKAYQAFSEFGAILNLQRHPSKVGLTSGSAIR